MALFAGCATGDSVPYDPNNIPSGCTMTPDGQGIIAADFDRDGDVDQGDFGRLQRCLSGDGVGFSGGCDPADLDSDGDVDEDDFRLLHACLAGADGPPGC